MTKEVEKETKFVDILPLSKGKRILVYLADFFLNFILSFLLFAFLIAPIGKAMTGFETLNAEHETVTTKMYSLFYKNNLVFKSPDYPEYDLADNIDYTYNYFISYYACDNETVLTNEAYGHKIENQVIYHYFNDLMPGDHTLNEDGYHTLFIRYDNNTYFENTKSMDETRFDLKAEYKEAIEPMFDSRNEISAIGTQYFNDIKSKVFLPLFAEVMTSIKNLDLSHADVDMSYNQCINRINDLENYHKTLLTICASVSYVFSSCIYYLLIPCIISNKKTLAMLFMQVERVRYPSLENIKNGAFIGSFGYSLLSNAAIMFFLPALLVPFNILFSFTISFCILIFSIILNIIGLLLVIFNEYNKTWNDLITLSVYIKREDLDEIYKARGYKI